jgi:predicted alpha/beta-fold hydrolase
VGYTPTPFRPRFTGGHKQTLYAWAKKRRFPALPEPEARYIDVAEDARVLAHCHFHPERARHPALILLHGLEGSSYAHYMRGMAEKAWAAGWNVVRLNQRNCGGTEHLSRGLYHSGLTADAKVVLRQLVDGDGVSQIAVAGYSLGGNLALRLAGEYGDAPPAELIAVVAVSPTMDLPRCVEALERRSNAFYHWNFLRNLRARMQRKAVAWPGVYELTPLPKIRSIRQFDETYTAPHHGFENAADYYHRASALRLIDRVTVPTLILTATNDPFVPPDLFRLDAVAGNPHITTVLSEDGGHCAFVERATPDYDGYWAEREVVRFVSSRAAL